MICMSLFHKLYPTNIPPETQIIPLVRLYYHILVVLDVVVPNQGHPDQGSGSQGEWEVLRQTKRHGLEDKKLTGKM